MAQVTVPPAAISLEVRLTTGTLATAAGLAAEALRASTLPTIAKWSVPATARRKLAKPDRLPDELGQAGVETATIELADGSLGSVFKPFGEAVFTFRLDALVPKHEPASAPAVLAALRSVCHALAHDELVRRVSLAFQGEGALCIPTVPVIGKRTYLMSCTEDEVAEAYEDPDAFWRSGWDAIERVDSRAIVERAMHATGSVEYLAHVQSQQWALARAAKAGRIAYALPQVLPEEREVYRGEPPTLSLVGYAAKGAEVELSCAARPPTHVEGYEIYDLYGLKQAGVLQDGRPVRGIRVVFAHEDTARSERRPLLDVGARVLYYDTAGELQALSD